MSKKRIIAILLILFFIVFLGLFIPINEVERIHVIGDFDTAGLYNCNVKFSSTKLPIYRIIIKEERTYIGVWNVEGLQKYIYNPDDTIQLEVVNWKHDIYTGEPVFISYNTLVESINVFYDRHWEITIPDTINWTGKKIGVIPVTNSYASYRLDDTGWYMFVPNVDRSMLGDYSVTYIRCIPSDAKIIQIVIRLSGYMQNSNKPIEQFKYLYFSNTEGSFETAFLIDNLENIAIDIILYFEGKEVDREYIWVG